MGLKIVSAYHGMRQYVETVRQNPETDRVSSWREHFLDAYWDDWAAGQLNEDHTRDLFSQPYDDIDTLRAELIRLAASNVEEIIEAEYARIARWLPPPIECPVVCVTALNPANSFVLEKMHGVVGSRIGDNTLIEINALADGWRDWIGYALAHEHHHSVWGHHYFYLHEHSRMDLLTALIVEGQADSFSCELHPSLCPAWTTALSAEQEADQWAKLKPLLASEDPQVRDQFFFGDTERGIPPFSGYSIGYKIVQNYLAHHEDCQKTTDLLELDPWEIFQGSGY